MAIDVSTSSSSQAHAAAANIAMEVETTSQSTTLTVDEDDDVWIIRETQRLGSPLVVMLDTVAPPTGLTTRPL